MINGHYTKSLTPIKEFKESLKLLAPMDRIRQLETERAAKRTLWNSNKREEAEAENIYYEASSGRTFGCERRIKGEIAQV